MADYYNIIKKTLNNLGETSPALRDKIFSSARNTIHKQLENTANLSPEVINTHKANLETAINQLESEYGQAAQAEQIAQPAPAPAPAPTQAPQTPQAQQAQPVSQAAAPQEPLHEAAPQAQPADEQTVLSIPDIPESDAKFASKPKGNLSRTIFMGLGALVVAGIGYLAFENQDKIMKMFDGGPNATQDKTAKTAEPASTPLAEKKPEKMEQRLGSNGEEIASKPVAASTDSQTTAEAAIKKAEEKDVKTAEAEIKSDEASTTPASQDAAAQKAASALFYEEGKAADAGERLIGEIKWTLAQESIADGLPKEPVINATVKIPGNGLILIMNIKRNLDEALAASHIVELIFSVPDDFPGRQIEDARSLVFKQTEEARGVALVGVPVKVSDGIFLIALSNVEKAQTQNLEVLSKLDWIDIPLKYETARRALLSFKKGDEGKKVFDDALAAWEKL